MLRQEVLLRKRVSPLPQHGGGLRLPQIVLDVPVILTYST
jgi:hypothetical protein